MILLFLFLPLSFANDPSTALQLERLINQSESQLETLKEMSRHSRQDSQRIAETSAILQKLSQGIDRTLDELEGSPAFETALLQWQAKDDFARTYRDAEQTLQRGKQEHPEVSQAQKALQESKAFQSQTVQANQEDLQKHGQIRQLLQTAEPGFVPKLNGEINLESWQTQVRISSQLTEMTSLLLEVREELRLYRTQQEGSNPLLTLIRGSEEQNLIQAGEVSLKETP